MYKIHSNTIAVFFADLLLNVPFPLLTKLICKDITQKKMEALTQLTVSVRLGRCCLQPQTSFLMASVERIDLVRLHYGAPD